MKNIIIKYSDAKIVITLVVIIIIIIYFTLLILANILKISKNKKVAESDQTRYIYFNLLNEYNSSTNIHNETKTNITNADTKNNTINETITTNEISNLDQINNINEKESHDIYEIVSNKEYYIKVNYQENVVTIYKKESENKYVPHKAMICSTGTYTPKSGKYDIKSKWVWGALQHNVYGHYVTQITGNILFHSVPYTAYGKPNTLQYEEFDKLGTSASLGCVRLQIKDTKWIYDNIPTGTTVEFYASSDPGPLGKPTAPKISENIECRNWDPTDTDPNNPWLIN